MWVSTLSNVSPNSDHFAPHEKNLFSTLKVTRHLYFNIIFLQISKTFRSVEFMIYKIKYEKISTSVKTLVFRRELPSPESNFRGTYKPIICY